MSPANLLFDWFSKRAYTKKRTLIGQSMAIEHGHRIREYGKKAYSFVRLNSSCTGMNVFSNKQIIDLIGCRTSGL